MEQFLGKAQVAYLLSAMRDEHVDRAVIDEEIHVRALVISEGTIE